MKKILIPIDGSECSNKAIQKGKEIAGAFDSNIILLNVNAWVPFAYEANVEDIARIAEESQKESEKLLETAKKFFEGRLNKVSVKSIETVSLTGEVGKTIVEFAEENDVDLIVIGHRGQTGLDRLLMGSVTMKVLHYAKAPILVVK